MRYFSAPSQALIPGIANPEATESFAVSAGLPIQHRFKQSRLCISPVIHGPPTRFLSAEEDVELLAHALVQNGSNCIYVYEHPSGTYGTRQHADAREDTQNRVSPDTAWFQRSLKELLEACNIQREQIVTVAGLGSLSTRSSSPKIGHSYDKNEAGADVASLLTDRLATACQLTGLRRIDFAVIEVHDATIEKQVKRLDEALDWLNAAVRAGVLQGYGVLIDVLPYTIHTPPQLKSGQWVTLPASLELQLSLPESACEFVAYSMSLTTAMPATYPMLPPPLEQFPEEFRTDFDRIRPERRLTRIAVDSFLARRGRGKSSEDDELDDDNENEESGGNQPLHQGMPFVLISPPEGEEDLVADAIAAELNELCPPLETSPRLQDKVLRAIMSIEVDCVIADAELAPHLGMPDVHPQQALTSDDTDDIFGTFVIPAELTA